MANGSSTLRERRPGVWEIRVYKGRTPDGKVQHVSRTIYGGKRKAEDARRALIAEVQRGKHRASKGTIAFLLDRYFAHMEANDASPSTLRTYRCYARVNIEPKFGHLDMLDLEPEMLDDWYAELRARTPPMAQSTVRQHHAILSGAYRQAKKWRWVESNPLVDATPPKAQKGKVTAPTVEDVQRLLVLAEERNPTLATLMFVAATTGARRGELCAMRWRLVDLDAGVLIISESVVEPGGGQWAVKGTKTGQIGRLALDKATVAALKAHRARVVQQAADGGVPLAPDAFMFSQAISGAVPYKPDRVTAFFGHLRADLGMDGLKLHHLRRFMATQAIAAGADIRTIAGRLRHDPAMTLKVYSAVLEEKDRGIADHMGALLRPD